MAALHLLKNAHLTRYYRLGRHFQEGAGAYDPNPTSLPYHSRYNAKVKSGVYCMKRPLSDPELEPFRNEIMVWYINRRELQALTVS